MLLAIVDSREPPSAVRVANGYNWLSSCVVREEENPGFGLGEQ
jgi:hypothetical protein